MSSLERQPSKVVFLNRLFRLFLYATISVALIGLVALLVDAFIQGEGRLSFGLITDSTSRIAENAGFR